MEDNWAGQDCVAWRRKLCLRARIVLVCDFRLGMGKEELFFFMQPAASFSICWDIPPLSRRTLALWNPYPLHPGLAVPP